AAGREQAAVLARRKHLVQQEPLSPGGGEAGAELREGGEVEPGVVELEPEGVLPVDAAADGVGGLAIGEVLGELQDGDQGELPGGQCGLPAPGVEGGEVGVAEDGSELVAEAEVGVPLGEGGAGDAGGQLGDVRDGAGLQGHGRTSGRSGVRCNPFHYSGLPPHREFADSIGYYVKNGRPTKEAANVRLALRPLRQLYGQSPAAGFGPLTLKAVRRSMVEAD